jgi:hypothetical protein
LFVYCFIIKSSLQVRGFNQKESTLKKIIVGLMMAMMLVTGFVFGQRPHKKINEFGRAPLREGGVHSEQELMDLFEQEPEAIAIVFGHQDELITVFLKHMIGGMEIQSRWFEAGSMFLSMANRWNGKILDTGEWEWTGKPFEAYVIVIEQVIGDFIKQYWLVVPKQCGNIGLWKIETIEIEEEIPEPKIREYPSRSINKQLPQPEPKPEPSPEIRLVFEKSKTEQSARVNYFVGVEAGEFISCREPYVLPEAGAIRHISKSIDMIMSIGIGLPVGEDRASWYTVPIIGIGLQAKFFDPFYFGVEAGLSGKMKDGLKVQIEFGGEFGFWVKNNLTIYLRARAPFDEKIGWNYKVLAGIRIFF